MRRPWVYGIGSDTEVGMWCWRNGFVAAGEDAERRPYIRAILTSPSSLLT